MAKTPGTGATGGGGSTKVPTSIPGSGSGKTPGVGVSGGGGSTTSGLVTNQPLTTSQIKPGPGTGKGPTADSDGDNDGGRFPTKGK